MNQDEFRELLRNKSAEEIVETYIISDDPGPYTSRDALNQLEKTARITFRLADDEPLSTIVVGSAKLGFAFLDKPARNGVAGKPAYRAYVPGESDIDVAVVSPALYKLLWRDLARHGAAQATFPSSTALASYMFHGWIRPDKFPYPAPARCNEWKTMLRRVQSTDEFRYKNLRCGLYFSAYYLQLYQQRGVRAAQRAEMDK